MNGYDMLMPFVVVESNGGPYEDSAFCAGWELGQLWEMLRQAPNGVAVSIRHSSVPQADLVAMHFGYVMTIHSDDDEWASIEFTKGGE